ncbi:MAG: hypothetical protein ACXWF8_12725 [Methylobacter sp.]
MNMKVVKLLVYICIGLSLVTVAEWLYAGYSRRQLVAEIEAVHSQDYKSNLLPQIELARQPEQSYQDLVARPLFIKGRRPAKEAEKEVFLQGLAGQSDNFDWQVNGIFSTRNKISALLSRVKTKVAKDNYRKVTVGDQLDGWKIAEINKDRVIVTQGANEKELLLHTPKAKESAPPQPQEASPFPPPPAPKHSPLPPAPEPPPPDAPAPTEEPSESNQ